MTLSITFNRLIKRNMEVLQLLQYGDSRACTLDSESQTDMIVRRVVDTRTSRMIGSTPQEVLIWPLLKRRPSRKNGGTCI